MKTYAVKTILATIFLIASDRVLADSVVEGTQEIVEEVYITLYAKSPEPVHQLLEQDRIQEFKENVAKREERKCNFNRRPNAWMDGGGAEYDFFSQVVTGGVEECEKLCCDHNRCKSYTLWYENTCYLRASALDNRPNDHASSGYKVQTESVA